MIVYIVIDKITGEIVEVYDSAQGAVNHIAGKLDYFDFVTKNVLTSRKTEIKSIIEVNEKVYDPLHFNSVLKFGKHKGETVGDILQSSPDYLQWCINNLNTKLDEHCLDLLTIAMEKYRK